MREPCAQLSNGDRVTNNQVERDIVCVDYMEVYLLLLLHTKSNWYTTYTKGEGSCLRLFLFIQCLLLSSPLTHLLLHIDVVLYRIISLDAIFCWKSGRRHENPTDEKKA